MRGCSTSAGEVSLPRLYLVLYAISLIVYFTINGEVEDDSR